MILISHNRWSNKCTFLGLDLAEAVSFLLPNFGDLVNKSSVKSWILLGGKVKFML